LGLKAGDSVLTLQIRKLRFTVFLLAGVNVN
jgi:hypothetical protein